MIAMGTPEGIAPGVEAAMGAQGIQVEGRQKDPFALPCFDEQHIARMPVFILIDAIESNRVAIVRRSGVVSHRQPEHIFIGTGTKLREAIEVESTGVGNQDDLGPLQHEDAGAFGKFTVVTDHRSHLERPLRCLEGTHREIVSRCTGKFPWIEVAGMDLGVGQDQIAVLIDQRHRITWMAWSRRPCFEIGECKSHREFAGQFPEMGHEEIVPAHGLIQPALVDSRIRFVERRRLGALPTFWRFPDIFLSGTQRGNHIPGFRKEGEIGPHRLSAATASRHLE
jgi:hypothetical protein